MTTRPSALVLEDSRSAREELTTLLRELGLEVWSTSSPVAARSWISRTPDVDLAVIDWDMRYAGDNSGEPNSERVLVELAQKARETMTVVYARDVMRVVIFEAIQRAHPAALIHDKAQGSSSLQKRLVALLSPHVGDLELDDRSRNFVRHIPSGRVYKHRVAFRLLTNHPREVMVLRSERARLSGLDRFRRWLEEVDSEVRVEPLGGYTQRYHLVVVKRRGRAAHNRRAR